MSAESREHRSTAAIRRAKGWALLAGVSMLALLGFFLLTRGENLDHQGCPESGPTREVIVLIDTSDPLSQKHKAELRRILREMTSPAASGRHGQLAMTEGERVTFYRLEANDVPTGIDPICHPGNPQHRSWIQGLSEGRIYAQQRWIDFRNGLFENLEELFPPVEDRALQVSPILETIAVVTAHHADSQRANQDLRSTHLIVISDLLQNTGLLSHYEPYPPPQEIPRELRTDLSRVEVSLFRLERHKYEIYQTPEHYYWWTDWVEEMGGKVVWQQAL